MPDGQPLVTRSAGGPDRHSGGGGRRARARAGYAVHYDDEERPARIADRPRSAARSPSSRSLVALLVLWQVFRPLAQGSQFYLIIFLAGVLPLVFLGYRSGACRRSATRPAGARTGATAVRWTGCSPRVALVVCLYPVSIRRRRRATTPSSTGRACSTRSTWSMGALLLVLVLEACRRTTGWVLPVVCLVFLAYGYYGGLLPQTWPIAHAGLDFAQIVDALYNSGSGFYGTPLDVAATYIVLFTIYGAVLELSGAGRFFVDLSVAAFRRSRSAAGRTAVASGFLLGTVSGSGTATAVSVGAVTWPILRRAGYPAEQAGGMLAAAGVGRDPVPADAGRGRVHRRRVPGRLLPDRARLGDDPDDPLLPGHPARGRDRRAALRGHGRSRSPPARRGGCWPRFGYHFSSLIADRRAARRSGSARHPRGRLRHRAGRRRCRSWTGGGWLTPATAVQRAVGRRARRAAGRRGLRRGRHHHRDHHQDRPRRAARLAAGARRRRRSPTTRPWCWR